MEIVEFFHPKRLLITGDLFHSTYNKELDYFFKWRSYLNDLPMLLVRGNHDAFPDEFYHRHQIAVCKSYQTANNFCFVHDKETASDTDVYTFSGHLHPAIRVYGTGKQLLRLPCYYFGKEYAVLPAFGNFTGMANISPTPGDDVFAITEEEVIKIQ